MLTLTDLFCGAGGSSTGATQVPGVSVEMAINHWDLAVETHNTNHPTTRHDCANISQSNPRRYPKTDVLWGSPECTNHSIAGKGRLSEDDAAVASRATMWDLIRFTEYHDYRAVIFENVPDIMKWQLIPAWIQAWDDLGRRVQWVFMNSMHATGAGDGAPQSRERAYAVITKKGDRQPDLEKWTRPSAYCAACGETVKCVQSWRPSAYTRKSALPPELKAQIPWGSYGLQYDYACPRCKAIVRPEVRSAASVIDWSLPAKRIGDRPLREFVNKTTGEVTIGHLSPKTMGRIVDGLRKYYSAPQLVPCGGTWNDTAYPAAQPMRTRTSRENEGLLIPVEGRDGKLAKPSSQPLRTQTARRETGLLIPYYGKDHAFPTDDPHRTFTSKDRFGLMIPLRNHNSVKPAHEAPFDTFAASGNHHGLAMPEAVDIDPLDCDFRMLDPLEILLGMAFPATYIMLGTRRQQVRLSGNAVCPPNARDLVSAVAEALS